MGVLIGQILKYGNHLTREIQFVVNENQGRCAVTQSFYFGGSSLIPSV